MKKTVILLSITMLMFSGCEQVDALFNKMIGKKQEKAKPMMMPPRMVQIIEAKKQDVELNFQYPATIVSDEDVQIRSKVSGTLLKRYFKAGQRVKKGDKLYTIDPKVYQAQYNVQVANVNVAKATLLEAEKEYKRAKALYAKRATSQRNYDSAYSAYEVAKAGVAQAKASRDSAKVSLDYTDVTAPFSGVVGDALTDVGEYVPVNTPLVRVTQTNPVYAQFYIPDVRQFTINKNIQNNLWSKTNSNALIKYGNKEYKGKITFIDKIINATSGSVQAKAKFDNANNSLPVGSFVKVHLNGFEQKSAFKIPSLALQQNLASTFLYVVRPVPKEILEKLPPKLPPIMKPNGVVGIVPISIDYEGGDFVLVSGGLKEGDKIIMNNFKKIYPSAQINVTGIYGQAPKKAPQSAPKKAEKK